MLQKRAVRNSKHLAKSSNLPAVSTHVLSVAQWCPFSFSGEGSPLKSTNQKFEWHPFTQASPERCNKHVSRAAISHLRRIPYLPET